jgi:hypothetical protein
MASGRISTICSTYHRAACDVLGFDAIASTALANIPLGAVPPAGRVDVGGGGAMAGGGHQRKRQWSEALEDNLATTAQDRELVFRHGAAVRLGRLGGLKGGDARASKMSERARSMAARRAAKARWK